MDENSRARQFLQTILSNCDANSQKRKNYRKEFESFLAETKLK